MGMLFVCRVIGAVGLFLLYTASKLVDRWLFGLAGVQVSVIELLIMVSTLAQSSYVVRACPACLCPASDVQSAHLSRGGCGTDTGRCVV